jgi:hypothetical protein
MACDVLRSNAPGEMLFLQQGRRSQVSLVDGINTLAYWTGDRLGDVPDLPERHGHGCQQQVEKVYEYCFGKAGYKYIVLYAWDAMRNATIPLV